MTNKDTTAYINSNIFFLIENGEIILWNYKDHEQYIIDDEHFKEILNINKTGKHENEKVYKNLFESNIINHDPQESNNWGWDILSKIFHIGTKDVFASEIAENPEESAKNYLQQCADLDLNEPSLFLEKQGKLVELPDPDINMLHQQSFFSVLKNRKTCRNFNGKPITIGEISTLLYSSFGLIHGNEWSEFSNLNLKKVGIRKASPASGALHAEEIYVLVYHVIGLEPGVYHYRPQDHKLTLLTLGDFEKQVIVANYNQTFSSGLAFGVYLTCRFDKLWWKYKHSRSLKVALLDLGHASQTFLLSATALGLKTWITGAFQDSVVNDIIQVDGVKESALLFLGAGYGTDQSIPNEILEALRG